jgi:hypothetical protein
MSSRLDRRSEWEKFAAQSGYRVEEMARRCKISPRQLQRHFLALFGQTPKHWLDELRARAVLGEDDSAWDATVEADNTNDALVIKVTGSASATIRWVATVRTTEAGH